MIAVTPWNNTVQAPPSVKVLKTRAGQLPQVGDCSRKLTLGTCKDVESDQESVVEQKHDGGDLECDRRAPREQESSHVANIGNLGVLHAELPEDV